MNLFKNNLNDFIALMPKTDVSTGRIYMMNDVSVHFTYPIHGNENTQQYKTSALKRIEDIRIDNIVNMNYHV